MCVGVFLKLLFHLRSCLSFVRQMSNFFTCPQSNNLNHTSVRNVTFRHFVTFLIDLDLRKETHLFDEHWALYSDLCAPCLIDYDIIGRSMRVCVCVCVSVYVCECVSPVCVSCACECVSCL